MDQALAELRQCMVPNCGYKIPNALTDIDHILGALGNHIAGIHPVVKSEGGGGAAKSTATIPLLQEAITETQYAAWK